MSRISIGGALDFEALRQLHRPRDAAQLAAEVRRLASTGLKPRDLAAALRMPLQEVLHALRSPPPPTSVATGAEQRDRRTWSGVEEATAPGIHAEARPGAWGGADRQMVPATSTNRARAREADCDA